MAPSFFCIRVIRCPACGARVPLRDRSPIVVCEYCDAHVQVGGIEHATHLAPDLPPLPGYARPIVPMVAQPSYSAFAYLVSSLPLLFISGGSLLFIFWWNTSSLRAERSGSVAGEERPREERKEPSRAPAQFLSASRVQERLASELVPCLEEAGAHRLEVVMAMRGESHLVWIKTVMAPLPRVDGIAMDLAGTSLGRCIEAVGKTMRSSRSAIPIDVRNPGRPDPLVALPETPPLDELEALIEPVLPDVHACAREHAETGRRTLSIRIDGPSGTLASLGIPRASSSFHDCVSARFRELEYPRSRAYEFVHRVELELDRSQ